MMRYRGRHSVVCPHVALVCESLAVVNKSWRPSRTAFPPASNLYGPYLDVVRAGVRIPMYAAEGEVLSRPSPSAATATLGNALTLSTRPGYVWRR